MKFDIKIKITDEFQGSYHSLETGVNDIPIKEQIELVKNKNNEVVAETVEVDLEEFKKEWDKWFDILGNKVINGIRRLKRAPR